MFLKYILHHKLIFIVGMYFVFSVVLKSLTGIDICLPCLWKTLFGLECIGCGLTRASVHLVQLDFSRALESNWIIFIVLPAGLYYLFSDFKKFKNNQ